MVEDQLIDIDVNIRFDEAASFKFSVSGLEDELNGCGAVFRKGIRETQFVVGWGFESFEA